MKRKWINRAAKLSQWLLECGNDPDVWAERIGYDLVEADLPETLPAALIDGIIVIRPDRDDFQKIMDIAHEVFHHEFHGASIAHRDLSASHDDLEERQAESFALLVFEPDLWKYGTIENFYRLSAMPEEFKKMREDLFYKIKK